MSEQGKDAAPEVEALLGLVDEFLEHMAALEEENRLLRAQLGQPVASSSDREAAPAEAAVIVLDSDAARARSLAGMLVECGCKPHVASRPSQALALLGQQLDFAVALVQGDIEGEGGLGGLEFIRRARSQSPELECIVLVGFSSADKAVQALRIGASDFLIHPVQREDLESRVRAAVGRRQIQLRSRLYLSDFRKRYEDIRQRLRE